MSHSFFLYKYVLLYDASIHYTDRVAAKQSTRGERARQKLSTLEEETFVLSEVAPLLCYLLSFGFDCYVGGGAFFYFPSQPAVSFMHIRCPRRHHRRRSISNIRIEQRVRVHSPSRIPFRSRPVLLISPLPTVCLPVCLSSCRRVYKVDQYEVL